MIALSKLFPILIAEIILILITEIIITTLIPNQQSTDNLLLTLFLVDFFRSLHYLTFYYNTKYRKTRGHPVGKVDQITNMSEDEAFCSGPTTTRK